MQGVIGSRVPDVCYLLDHLLRGAVCARKLWPDSSCPRVAGLRCPPRYYRGVISPPDMNSGGRWIAILLLGISGLSMAQQADDFSGTWLLKFNDQPIFKLTLTQEKGGITGSLTKPSQLTTDEDGDVTGLGPDQVNLPIQKATLNGGKLELTIDGDRFMLALEDYNRALLVTEGMRPLHLERTSWRPGDSCYPPGRTRLSTRNPRPARTSARHGRRGPEGARSVQSGANGTD